MRPSDLLHDVLRVRCRDALIQIVSKGYLQSLYSLICRPTCAIQPLRKGEMAEDKRHNSELSAVGSRHRNCRSSPVLFSRSPDGR